VYRQTLYILPAIVLAVFVSFRTIFNEKSNLDWQAKLVPTVLFVSFLIIEVLVTVMNGHFLDAYFLKDLVFYAVPVTIALLIRHVEAKEIWFLSFTSVAAIFISYFATSDQTQALDILRSSAPLETSYVFPLWLCLLTLLMTAKRSISFVVLIGLSLIAVLALKRIALAAAVLSYALFLMSGLVLRNSSLRTERIMARLLTFSSFFVLLGVGYFFTDVFDFVNAALIKIYRHSPEEILLGRYDVQNLAIDIFAKERHAVHLFGNGLGYSSRLVASIKGHESMRLLHNDMLRVVLELGLIGSLLLGLVLTVLTQNIPQAFLLVFQFIIMLTDNTISYVFHTVPLVCCFQYLRHQSPSSNLPLRWKGSRVNHLSF
jgi:hypothetical protein